MDNIKDIEFFKKEINYLNDNQEEQLYKYYKLIREYNKVMNLTGIDDIKGVYLKHFYDSLTIRKNILELEPKTIADVGTGAGFPGIVLAIAFPNIKVYLIEPLTKRCNFLNEVINQLELKNVIIYNKRAEEIEEKFDLVVSRAVARLNILLELTIPIVEVSGYAILLKGSVAKEEIEGSLNAFEKLDCKVEEIDELILPIEESKRINILVKKNKETNKKYPRNFGQIKNNPL